MLKRQSLERRLFGWLMILALVPSLVLLAAGAWFWRGSLDWVGTLGPWDRVAESGRELFEAAETPARGDSTLALAVDRHRRELSSSLLLARRWDFIEQRVGAALLPLTILFALFLAALALAASRRLARELARPIRELVDWTEALGRGETLPERESRKLEIREVGVLRDALRRASADLAAARERELEAERLRVWGDMARWIAHEIKNPLTPLRLAAHRLTRRSNDADVLESASVIDEETARLEELALQFSALGRPPEGPRSEVDLHELLEGLLDTDVPGEIETVLIAEPDLPRVEGHYEELLRAFRNLVKNAVEAMEGSQVRRLELRLAGSPPASSIDGDHGRGHGRNGQPHASARQLLVEIADSGPGIPEELLDRVFEPEFSTKRRGTGLGLAIVRKAIVAHGGDVHARRRPGGGAAFVVRLPAAEHSGAPA